ncbi:hypothetical protein ACFSB1_08055 [Halopseudomonas phragmitis]|uniref:Uncharacterized protein n=1 Tax=Halopseudomonas phragmitis TaxID=1931241 RepID=A0A1V0B1A0_9GAMM|nr:hypothetical protein [Halopseudomonas phragmitis]AQZ93706.1 hypothetical protein BVH74_02555 [Halopseudomonas phragmitis]
MLFKEKLLLSNCDSVRGLSGPEWRKRFLTGLAFADGVVLSPNTLIDNAEVVQALSQQNVIKYLNEEGSGKLVIRGFNLSQYTSLLDYYQALPDNFIISSLPGAPSKGQLSSQQQRELLQRLQRLQQALGEVKPRLETLVLARESLRDEIFRRLDSPDAVGQVFESDGERTLFMLRGQQCISRSDWYSHAQAFFHSRGQDAFARFRAEVIDPAYNALFAVPNEGFLQDNIRFLQGVPEAVLDSGIAFKALRREIELIQYPLKVFNFISSLGAGEVARFLTDEALNYLEDKMTDVGEGYLTRRNWFGMYPRLRQFMGLEIK